MSRCYAEQRATASRYVNAWIVRPSAAAHGSTVERVSYGDQTRYRGGPIFAAFEGMQHRLFTCHCDLENCPAVVRFRFAADCAAAVLGGAIERAAYVDQGRARKSPIAAVAEGMQHLLDTRRCYLEHGATAILVAAGCAAQKGGAVERAPDFDQTRLRLGTVAATLEGIHDDGLARSG